MKVQTREHSTKKNRFYNNWVIYEKIWNIFYTLLERYKKYSFKEDITLKENTVYEIQNTLHSTKYLDTPWYMFRFQKYLFFKAYSAFIVIGVMLGIFIFLTLKFSGIWIVYWSVQFLVLKLILEDKDFLQYIHIKFFHRKINIVSLSPSPKTYTWKDKNTLYLK